MMVLVIFVFFRGWFGLSEFVDNGGQAGVVGCVAAGRWMNGLYRLQQQRHFGGVAFDEGHHVANVDALDRRRGFGG
jgi:hypothetical protein